MQAQSHVGGTRYHFGDEGAQNALEEFRRAERWFAAATHDCFFVLNGAVYFGDPDPKVNFGMGKRHFITDGGGDLEALVEALNAAIAPYKKAEAEAARAEAGGPGAVPSKAKKVPKEQQSVAMRQFAEARDAEWFDLDGYMVCFGKEAT